MKRLLARLAARELSHAELKEVSGGYRPTYEVTMCTEGPDEEGIYITYSCDRHEVDKEWDV